MTPCCAPQQGRSQRAGILGRDEDAVDAVTKRPLLAGAVAAATVLFAAREPIMNLVGPLFDRNENSEEDGTDAQG